MTSQTLPDRPNLEQLKKQAKSLLHAARAREPAALRRFQILPALASRSLAELQTADLALHDAQSVIAREHGFKSWNELREHVEERTLSFAAAVEEFVQSRNDSFAFRNHISYLVVPGFVPLRIREPLFRNRGRIPLPPESYSWAGSGRGARRGAHAPNR